jgi:hypothetical protein
VSLKFARSSATMFVALIPESAWAATYQKIEASGPSAIGHLVLERLDLIGRVALCHVLRGKC